MLATMFFLAAFIGCFVIIMAVPRGEGEEKISLLSAMVVSNLIEVSIGAVVSFFVYKIGVKTSLWSVGCIYLLAASIIYFIFLRGRKIQKYSVTKLDAINFGAIVLILLFVVWRVFSFNLDFRYINSDPGVHFGYAMKVFKNGKLTSMPFSAIYNGLFVKLLVSIIPTFETYKAFIIADTISNFMSGAMFYVLFSEVIDNKLIRKISPIFTILYFVGWPVYNYVMGGFVYWGAGASLIMLGFFFMYKYYKKNIKDKLFYSLMILVMLAQMTCYGLFLPYMVVMYGVPLFIMYFSKAKDKKKFIIISLILLLVCLMFVVGFVLIYFKGDINKFFYFLSYDGGIHRSLYKDMMYFIPFEFILFAEMIKNKKMNITCVSFFSLIIVCIFTFILVLVGIMASYYYYKIYYVLWILGWLVTAEGLGKVIEEKQSWIIGYGICIAFMFVYSFTPIEDLENKAYNGKLEKASPEFPMYSEVGSFIKNVPEVWAYPKENGFFEVVDYVLKLGREVPVFSKKSNFSWYKKMTSCKKLCEDDNINVEKDFFEDLCLDTDYFCIEKATNYYKKNSDELAEIYDIVLETDYGVIYHK